MRGTVLGALMVLLLVGAAEGGTVTLAWNPNSEPDLAGYLLSYGTGSGEYTTTIDVGNVISFQFTEPNPLVRYYLALRAYNTAGAISPYSNEVITTPVNALTLTGLSSNRTSPQLINTTITFSATATGGTAPYQFKWLINNGTTSTVGRQWATASTFAWTPSAAGTNYTITVWARNASSTADAPANPSATLAMAFTITAGTVNAAPNVNAGNNRTITLPATTTLSGTASDDGQPVPPGRLTINWTRASGPGTVTFSTPTTAATVASFGAAGTYVLRLTASDGALSRSDDVTVTVNAATGGGTGTGLTGSYYNDPTTGARFTTLVTTRRDARVNFSWDQGRLPAPGVQLNYFSVRWTGQVLAPQSGAYRFSTTANDGVRVWVNGQLVIDDWVNRSSAASKTSAPVTLSAGQRYSIRVDYYERTGNAQVQLRWIRPDGQQEIVPTASLFP